MVGPTEGAAITVCDKSVGLVPSDELWAAGKKSAGFDDRGALEGRGGESMSMTTEERTIFGGVEEDKRRSGMVYAEGTGSAL